MLDSHFAEGYDYGGSILQVMEIGKRIVAAEVWIARRVSDVDIELKAELKLKLCSSSLGRPAVTNDAGALSFR